MPDATPDELKESVRLFPAVKVLVKFHLGLLTPFLALFALLFGFYGFAIFLLSVFLGISLIVSAMRDWLEFRTEFRRFGESSEHSSIHQVWKILAFPGRGLDVLLDRLAHEFAVRISSSTRRVALSPRYLRLELVRLAEDMGWKYSGGKVEGEGEVVKVVVVDRPQGIDRTKFARKAEYQSRRMKEKHENWYILYIVNPWIGYVSEITGTERIALLEVESITGSIRITNRTDSRIIKELFSALQLSELPPYLLNK